MTCAYSPPLWISYYRPVGAAATRRGAHRIALPRACRYTRQGTDHTCMAMPKILKAFTVVAATSLAVRPRIAWAHHFMGGGPPETFAQGLLSGLGHPVIGLDHAAFIVAAGFFLASVEGGMWGILALIAGGLLMARRQIRLSWLASGLALASILHGYAYAESIFGAEAAPLGAYLVGFSVIQLGIAAAAFFIHRRLIATREAWARPVSSGLGAVVGAIGVVFLLINIAS